MDVTSTAPALIQNSHLLCDTASQRDPPRQVTFSAVLKVYPHIHMSQSAHPGSEILTALRAHKSALRNIGVFSAVINLLMLVPSLYMLQVYDRVLQSRSETTLWMLSAITLGLFALISVLEYVRSQVAIHVGAQLDAQLNRRIYTAAFETNLRQGGYIAGQALNDLTTLRQFISGSTLFAFFDAPWFPLYLGVIFLFDFHLGLFALCGAAVLIALAVVNERISRQPLDEAGRLSLRSAESATVTLRNAEAIEAMGMLGPLQARWLRIHEAFLGKQGEASEKASMVGAWTRFARIALQSMVLGVGALLVLDNQITAGMMIAASILMGKTLSPVEGVIGGWKQWSAVRAAHERLHKLLAANPARRGAMSLPRPRGQLAVSRLVAGAPGTAPVLKNVNFALPPGEVLGVIGPSASGKSTLARLLVGVWPPLAGEVRLDGADVWQWNKDELGPFVGYLPQDIELFAGTVAENIARFGEVDAETVVEAARLAGVHDMVLKLPKGYGTELGPDGAGLSGGQKQRIALARALYGSPALVVLDEPNSNLDEAGEAALARAITLCRERGATVVIVSHRSNILAVTTRLLVLQDGTSHAFGPTQEVLRAMQQRAQPQHAGKPAAAAQGEPARATGTHS
ncbi:ATP-binding cassette subfamily C exporter for protease/lipase [Cupriavidus alkaliphilus]|nr:ATP-binding cassette subfamily C exporter for protease/lipase [Cupriavidus alkaliphilus]